MNRDSLELNTPGIFRFYGLYLLVVSSFLLSSYSFSIDFINLAHFAKRIFPILISGYFFLAVTVSVLSMRRAHIKIQYKVALFFCDISLITGLIYSSGGLEQGLAIALLVTVLFANITLPKLFGLLVAAMATLSIMVLAFALNQQGVSVNPLAIGAFGSSYFLIALLLQRLQSRLFMTLNFAEEQSRHLAKYQQLNDLIVDRMITGVIVMNEAHEIVTSNRSARRLLGIEAEETWLKAPATLIEFYQQWLQQSNAIWHNRPISEKGIPLDLHIQPIDIEGQKETIIFVEDSAEVKERAQDLKLRSLGQLTASIAHEIRNPLGAISHAAQLFTDIEERSEEDEKLIRIINTNTTRINELIESVLTLARRKKTQAKAFELTDWLHTYVDQKRELDHIVALKLPAQNGLNIAFDKIHLTQILDNLLDNAKQNAREGAPRLCIELHEDRAYQRYVLSVSDDGVGIDENIVDHLFEPFFTTRPSGVGLGLYLCRELCEANQAHIRYAPRPRGACFQIVLPRLVGQYGRSV
jgi:two-component system sensor histidine kinase PilS (NtrC family)